MTSNKTPGAASGDKQNEPKTEADVKSIDGNSGQSKKSSHDEKSNTKAGQDTGAGGGTKQERKH